MNILNKIYCRIYQLAFRAALPLLPYRDPEIYNSVGDVSLIFKKLHINNALLVTDSFLKESGATAHLEDTLRNAGIRYSLYDKTCPNPTTINVEEAFSMYCYDGCEAIIAFGGGSSIDCAKAVGARAAYPKRSLDKLKGLLKVLKRIPVLIAIPTTAGTGSETTLAAVVTDPVKKHKYALYDFTLIPRYAILDATVTYSLPPHLTSTTGMDALTHAIEAYIGKSTTQKTRRLSLEAVKLIFENIETAYNEPANSTARSNMLLAAYKAGVAFSMSYVGYIHCIAHSLGGEYNIPHGLANSVLLPVVLEEYGDSIYKKLHQLAIAAGVASENTPDKDAALTFIQAIREKNDNMNIPHTLSGIKAADIPVMASHAAHEGNPLYPVPKLMDAKELEILYKKVSEETDYNEYRTITCRTAQILQ